MVHLGFVLKFHVNARKRRKRQVSSEEKRSQEWVEVSRGYISGIYKEVGGVEPREGKLTYACRCHQATLQIPRKAHNERLWISQRA